MSDTLSESKAVGLAGENQWENDELFTSYFHELLCSTGVESVFFFREDLRK